jgi:hypothetical protein
MMKKSLFICIIALSHTVTSFSQEAERASSSMYLQALGRPDVNIPFAISAEGKRFNPTWGLDQAWINEQNLMKGVNHMGKENIGIGRSAFRYSVALTNDSVLGAADIAALRSRNTVFDKFSKTLPLILTADQEAVGPTEEEPDRCPPEYFVKNKSADIDHWAAMINSHVHWMQANTKHPIVGISPFNEPDYWTLEEGATTTKQWQVAKLLKEKYPRCAEIPMVGGNTLNNDKALDWYTSGKSYYDWGNTHQLAGSFDTFAGFYQQLAKDGKVGYADEMHNVGEAMIGLEYGMTIGIWWGFDSRARGEFCQISRNGTRLAYGEHRNNWTAASVYRHDDGRVKAFIGSSERQATTTSYQFVSTERDVYYDGVGPVREFMSTIEGGTGYTVGQTNAERVIDVTWGEDVQPAVINGTYKIVNKAANAFITYTASGSNITVQAFSASNQKQQWKVYPCPNTVGGDKSFYEMEPIDDAKIHMNVQDYSLKANGTVMAWTQDASTSNEQWYLEYAGDGYFFIRNRESALYLSSVGIKAGARLVQNTLQTGTNRDKQLWRIIPVDVSYDVKAPAAPANLHCTVQPASVKLMWDANTETDLEGYMVLRAPKGTDEWNTIARKLQTNYFTDNGCRQGVAYDYKVKAIDRSQNFSAASDVITATPTGDRAMIARWNMDDNLDDETANWFDIKCNKTPTYVTGHKDDSKAISMTNTSYLQLPYEIANSEELSIAMWVNWRSSANWQRIFDFGHDTDHYMFLTPKNSYTGKMRFAIKNGGDEQTLDCNTVLQSNQWKHVVVSLGKNKTTIYIDGVEAASTTGITIRPNEIKSVLNYLGRSQFAADPYFMGYLDDVRVYNYAVSADEVQYIMSDLPTGVENLLKKEKEEPSSVFGLDGIRRTSPSPGFNIINKKKVIVR